MDRTQGWAVQVDAFWKTADGMSEDESLAVLYDYEEDAHAAAEGDPAITGGFEVHFIVRSSSLTLTQCIDALCDWMADECVPEDQGGPVVVALRRVQSEVARHCRDISAEAAVVSPDGDTVWHELADRINAEVS